MMRAPAHNDHMNNTPAPLKTSDLATRPADARTICEQIGVGGLMAVGARDIVDLGDGIHFFVGRGRSRKIVVKLAANDTYAVELVRFNRADFTFTSEAFVELVYADLLQDVIVRMVEAAA